MIVEALKHVKQGNSISSFYLLEKSSKSKSLFLRKHSF